MCVNQDQNPPKAKTSTRGPFPLSNIPTSISTPMADSERPASPTPSERQKLDAEAKKKEQEEQAKLPYKWTQTIGEVDLTAPIPANLKGRDLDVKITKTSLKAGVKGQEAIIDVREATSSHTSGCRC